MSEGDLHPAITVYTMRGVDHEQLGRLVKAMCGLNGVLVAIELHQDPESKESQ